MNGIQTESIALSAAFNGETNHGNGSGAIHISKRTKGFRIHQGFKLILGNPKFSEDGGYRKRIVTTKLQDFLLILGEHEKASVFVDYTTPVNPAKR